MKGNMFFFDFSVNLKKASQLKVRRNWTFLSLEKVE